MLLSIFVLFFNNFIFCNNEDENNESSTLSDLLLLPITAPVKLTAGLVAAPICFFSGDMEGLESAKDLIAEGGLPISIAAGATGVIPPPIAGFGASAALTRIAEKNFKKQSRK